MDALFRLGLVITGDAITSPVYARSLEDKVIVTNTTTPKIAGFPAGRCEILDDYYAVWSRSFAPHDEAGIGRIGAERTVIMPRPGVISISWMADR